MNAQTKTQLTNAGIDTSQLNAEEAAILESMNADELKAFAAAQQDINKNAKAKKGINIPMMFGMF